MVFKWSMHGILSRRVVAKYNNILISLSHYSMMESPALLFYACK